jgi:hypothetical protein
VIQVTKKEKENKNRSNFVDVPKLPEKNCSLDVKKFADVVKHLFG